MRILDHLSSLSPLKIRTTAILMVIAVGIADYFTTVRISYSVGYLIPIVLAGWYDRKEFSLTLSLVCAVLWYIADAAHQDHVSFLIPVWNGATRVIIFGGVAWMLTTIRQTKVVPMQNELDRYVRIMETSIEGALVMDADGVIRYANPRAAVLLGYEAKALPGRHYTDIIRSQESRTLIEDVFRKGDGQVEVEFSRKDGGAVWTLIQARAMAGAKKDRDSTILLITDISYRKQAEEDLRRHYDEIVALQSLSAVLVRSFDLDRRLDGALKTVLDVMQFDSGGIYLVDPTGKELLLKKSRGLKKETVELVSRWEVGRGLTGRAFASRELIFVENDQQAQAIDSRVRALENIRSMAAVPLAAKDTVLGALIIASHQSYAFTGSQKSMLETFGSLIGVAIENAQLFEAARTREQQVSQLSTNLIMIQEEERKKFARNLHEGLAQLLTMLRVNAQLALENLGQDDAEAHQRIQEVISLVTEAEHEAKQISHDLRPSILDDFGLKAALEVLANNFERRTRIGLDLHLPPSDVRFESILETTVYRIVQELLANVAKHSHATRVTLQLLVRGNALALTVADNGKGFSMAEVSARYGGGTHNGLRNIRERVESVNGVFHVESSPGKGAEFSIEIPCTPASQVHELQTQLAS